MAVWNPLIWRTTYLSEIPSTDQMQFPVGAVGAPGITFVGANTTGFYYTGSSVRVSVGGVLVATFSSGLAAVTGGISATTAIDAGTLFSIGTNTVINANRLFLLRNYVVGSLPAASPDGAIAFVTDSTQTLIVGLGTPVVGGGTDKVPVYSVGGVWTIG